MCRPVRDAVAVQRSATAAGDIVLEGHGRKVATAVFKLKEVSRHRSTDVLASYISDAHPFENHAGEGFL